MILPKPILDGEQKIMLFDSSVPQMSSSESPDKEVNIDIKDSVSDVPDKVFDKTPSLIDITI